MTTPKTQEPNRATRRAAKKGAHKGAQPQHVAVTPSQHPAVMDGDSTEAETTADDEDSQDEARGFIASYQRFEAEARAVDARDVVVFSGNALIAFQNIRNGTLAVMAERSTLAADPKAPTVDWDDLALTLQAGEALVYAARLAAGASNTNSRRRALIAQMFEVRDVLLSNALGAVKAGVLKGDAAADVQKVVSGSGPLDGAQDCIDLAAIYRRYASALEGRTPVTAEQLARADALGAAVLHQIAPTGAVKTDDAPDAIARAADMRDRMAIVAARRYQEVARVAGWRWGFAMTEHVPALRSRTFAAKKLPG